MHPSRCRTRLSHAHAPLSPPLPLQTQPSQELGKMAFLPLLLLLRLRRLLLLLLLVASSGLRASIAGQCGYDEANVERSQFHVDGICRKLRHLGQHGSRPHRFSLEDFGAVGDGKTLNTRAFQNAIYHVQDFANKGGAQLYVPAGTWLTGSFNLTSHLTLYLDRDAVILGSQDFEDYAVVDPLPSYGQGRELPGGRHISLIHGENLEDVVITGENGTIDGQGAVWWTAFRGKTLDFTRPHLVELMWSTDIIISNITLANSPFWTLHPVYCTDVKIQDVTILSPHNSPNTDGIDPDSSTNVCIENCYISVGDDAISIKSGWDDYGIAYGCPSSNIVIRGLTAETPTSSGIAIGSEMSGGVGNVFAERVTIQNSRRGLRIKTSPGRGGYVENVTFTQVQMTNVTTAIEITSNYGEHPGDHWSADALPRIDRILYSSIVGEQIKTAGNLQGLQDDPFCHICLSYVSLLGTSTDWSCSNVTGFSSAVHPQACPELSLSDEASVCSALEGRANAWRTRPAWRRIGSVLAS